MMEEITITKPNIIKVKNGNSNFPINIKDDDGEVIIGKAYRVPNGGTTTDMVDGTDISGVILNIDQFSKAVYVHEVDVKSIKNNRNGLDNYPTIASLVANNTGSGQWTYIAPIGGTSTNYKLGLYPIEKYQYYRVIVSEIANNDDFNLTVTLKGGALTNEVKPYGSHYEHFKPTQRNRSVSFDESKNEIISHEAEDDNSLQYSEWIIPSILVGALSVAFFTKK
jgi:hypothetical protein